jgi:2-polyprenyl-3-methyl-5-hydroxy-6-metoxy-1,4-benzoquinol methylase
MLMAPKDKSSRPDIPLADQRKMWNRWNSQYRERAQGEVSARQAETVVAWLRRLKREDLNIIDVGCGTGWISPHLARFGRVTGTDLADEVISRARQRYPDVRFIDGDFMVLHLPEASFDVAVCLEVLSHIADQPAFIARVARLLCPAGLLMLATQNGPILNRASAIGLPEQGQLRRWLSARGLRRLLRPHFNILGLTSVVPYGDQGLLRFVNSVKLNRVLGLLLTPGRVERAKERLLLGHTLMVLARRRAEIHA